MFIAPPIESIELDALKILHLTLSPVALRLLGLIIHIISAFAFAKLVQKITKENKKISYIGFALFLFSPWTSFLSTFYLIQNILLLFFILTIRSKRIVLSLLIILVALFYLNNVYGKDYSFLKKISPKNLELEINESQRINYLSVERKFILPYSARLFIYNVPVLALDKTLNQFVSFFDYEQLTAPDKTYELIKLSGIPPKGNLPLFYFWEIPLVVLGVFLLLKSRFDIKFIAKLFIISIIPFMFFEKKLLAQTAFLSIIPILILESWGVYFLAKNLNKLFLFALLVIALIFISNFYKTLLFRPLSYQTPQPYLFREIANWLSRNYESNKNYIVTTRFGPTNEMTPYYLGKNYINISFKPFNLREDAVQKGTIYIGLPGEFVKPGKDLEEKDPPGGIEILEKIKGEDEPVFEYGKNIWIGKSF